MITVSLFKKVGISLLLCFMLVAFIGAKRTQSRKPRVLPLTSVHIVDRNGFAETISNKDRLRQYQNVNFLSQQPYQKVLRIYARDSRGNIRSAVTTYHDNGNPKQFLEILNGRANGNYCEWHENGNMSILSNVINGVADVTTIAEKSWLFHGPCFAWNDDGKQIAEVNYTQGSLEGIATYFHPTGQIWKSLPYSKNQLEGTVEICQKNGELLQQQCYSQGQPHGYSLRYWDGQKLASQEIFCSGRLENGEYFDKDGVLVSEVKNGNGFRVIFGKDHIYEMQEFVDGILEGEVKVFNEEGRLKRIYHVKNDIKHGEEVEYYDRFFASGTPPQPKISFYWHEGKIQGLVKTWYSNGNLECQKEMSNNCKTGVLSAWYRNGDLMMIEEYDKDKLLRGDYFRKDERVPVSQVSDGKGMVTIFDAEGHFVQKISYLNGKPEI